MTPTPAIPENPPDATAPAAPRQRELPILPGRAAGRRSRKAWRPVSLAAVSLLMVAHYVQWRITGSTVSPIEPSETMYTIASGAVNAGFIFFMLAILSTAILGRWVCGWGCHIVALQDLCAWMMRKIGITPRPFRSRLLIYVPLLVAAYMFLWPVALRFLARPAGTDLIPQFTNHLITSDYWATFPSVAVAVPFLLICGFVTVYFLGSKGFCTYGCPYGGVFVLADRISPTRIRVNDNCSQCGQCTVTCSSNVDVAGEVARYGMVVDPGCMKHLDCISVCPNDALYLGYGKPAITAKRAPDRVHSLTWPEEIFAVIVFAASYFAVWDVYLVVPMLMALGIAMVTTFLVIKSVQVVRSQDSALHRTVLRSQGRIYAAGWAFMAFSLIWTGLVLHSGYIRYNEFAGIRAFQAVEVPDELALAQADPVEWIGPPDVATIARGKRHLYRAFDGGFVVNTVVLQDLAWLEFLSGNADQALKLLDLTAKRQDGQARALTNYYRGAILNRTGRHEEALTILQAALADRPDLFKAEEEKGVALWQLGRNDEAMAAWRASAATQSGVVAKEMLAGALREMGMADASRDLQDEAARGTPDDPYFHWMLGLRLRELQMNGLAEKHFQRAVQLNSKFVLRRSRLQ